MDIGNVKDTAYNDLWLLWIKMLWTFTYKFLCEHMFSILLGIYLPLRTLCLVGEKFLRTTKLNLGLINNMRSFPLKNYIFKIMSAHFGWKWKIPVHCQKGNFILGWSLVYKESKGEWDISFLYYWIALSPHANSTWWSFRSPSDRLCCSICPPSIDLPFN